MREEGARHVRRWIILVIMALVIGIPIYVISNDTALVIVKNDAGTDVNVSVFFGPQPVGAGTIEAGASTWYVFNPHQDGDFAVGCRTARQPILRTEHVGYAPNGFLETFRIALGPCGHVKRFTQDTLL